MSTSEMDSGRSFEEVARNSGEMREPRKTRELDDREPQVIEREIDATRADMRETLEALERRFSFDRLVDMTVGRIRARGGEFAGNLTDAATQNPMPLLLTSIGLGWMMLMSRRGSRGASGSASGQWTDERSGTLGERMSNVRERAGRAADQVQGAMDSTRDTLKQAADSTRGAWRQAADSSRETAESVRSGATRAYEITREQAGMARERVDRLLHEQPLMLGALGLAAGAIIGALLPTSEHEDRFLGEMRDKAVKDVKDVAQKGRARLETALDHVAPSSSAERRNNAGGDGDSSSRATPRPH